VSDLAATIREALVALAAADPACKRFGASHHRYELAPPVPALAVGSEDLIAFATTVSGGGAGPYYGLLALDRLSPVRTPAGDALPVAHLGCGYAAVLQLATGEVWIDARLLGIARPIHPSFTAFYIDWIDRLARNAWPESFVPPGACALPNALGGYLAAYEQEHGIAAGTLAGEALREALGQLGPGAIEIAGGPPLFEPGDRVDPCIECARLVDNLGLSRGVIAPGIPPRPVR
jgi:hypothetical protein